MQSLDFNSLNQAFNGETWCNTFAYWLLVLNDPQSEYAQDAEEACAAVSFQHDVEAQAQGIETLIGDAELIPSVFIPIAPVTLAFRWSPFTAAIEALGPPLHVDTKSGATLAVFNPLPHPNANGSTADERHFDFLLRAVCERAIKSNSFVLLVGSPGWAYDSEDFIKEQPALQSLMREFGFVCTLRKPTD
jgi:hypothetical protein